VLTGCISSRMLRQPTLLLYSVSRKFHSEGSAAIFNHQTSHSDHRRRPPMISAGNGGRSSCRGGWVCLWVSVTCATVYKTCN